MKPYTILLLLFTVAFGASLQNSFVWDDFSLIVNNPNINLPWKEIPSVFITPMWKLAGLDGLQVYYRPIQSLFIVLNYKIWGLNPVGFHLTHIILHLINAIVLYRVGLLLFSSDNIINSPIHRFTDSPSLIALIAASIFAVHPVHNESVSRVASGEVILGFFTIITLYFYLKGNGYLSAFTFLLALLSKESAVMLPLALVVLAIHREGIKKGLLSIIPYILLVGAYLILRAMITDAVFGPTLAQPLLTRVFTMLVATLDYIRLLLVPYPLSPFYPARWYTSIFEPKVLTAIITIALIAYLAFRMRKDKTTIFLLLFPFIMLAPVIFNVNAFPILDYDRMYIAERFLYVPAMSYSLLISAFLMKHSCPFRGTKENENNPPIPPLEKGGKGGFEAFSGKPSDHIRRYYLITGSISVIIIFTAITISSTRIWRDDITLFERITENTPDATFAHNELGNAYMGQGRYRDAFVEYQTALKLKPDYAEAYFNLPSPLSSGEMLNSQIDVANDESRAIETLIEIIRIKPDHVEAYYILGIGYGELGMYKEAIEAYKYVLRLKPDDADVYYNLGVNYGKLGMHKEAIEAYKQSIKIKPDLADVHLNLAMAYLSLKDRDSALEEYKILKDLSPELANKLRNHIYNLN
jgi:Tfp pilus assembly protein PilF